jgi:hypothetical protein
MFNEAEKVVCALDGERDEAATVLGPWACQMSGLCLSATLWSLLLTLQSWATIMQS